MSKEDLRIFWKDGRLSSTNRSEVVRVNDETFIDKLWKPGMLLLLMIFIGVRCFCGDDYGKYGGMPDDACLGEINPLQEVETLSVYHAWGR